MSFPKFEEYLPGTILEVILFNYKPNDKFLLLILDETLIKISNCIAVYINGDFESGQGININHHFEITYQEVKKGGLRNGS